MYTIREAVCIFWASASIMRDPGLEQVIRTAGGVRELSRLLGISQPAISNWTRVPAARILQVESVTGVPRALIRPDLYDTSPMAPDDPDKDDLDQDDLDPIERARADEYALLSLLLWRAPSEDLLRGLSALKGDASPLGMAHLRLGMAAAAATARENEREFFRLFIGLGRGELLPYASYYLTGFLHERPLAKVREDLAVLGVERAERAHEPEDHIAMLCEVMSGIVARQFASDSLGETAFFDRHLQPWAARFFADLENVAATDFYRAIGALGRVFMDIEAEARTLPAQS
jgi:TorA maturation chaperone TorD